MLYKSPWVQFYLQSAPESLPIMIIELRKSRSASAHCELQQINTVVELIDRLQSRFEEVKVCTVPCCRNT